MKRPLRIHAICLAVNEDLFIRELLRSIYDVCTGISVVTQFDRDWYGKPVGPDRTIERVLAFPDAAGKIHLVCRRYRDEAAARNHEMMTLRLKPHKRIISHGMPIEEIARFHLEPDYFLIVDADEIYDTATIGKVIEYLEWNRPRGMRVSAYQYLWTWNRRIPLHTIHHHHFGFLRPGILFKMRRIVTWNEWRLQKLLRICHLPDISKKLYGFRDCPTDVGMFHHGSYLGNPSRLAAKFAKHSHLETTAAGYIDHIAKLPYEHLDRADLPENIRNGDWPDDFWDELSATDDVVNKSVALGSRISG